MTDSDKSQSVPMLGLKSHPLPMSAEMLSLVGEIVIHWSQVETAIVYDTASMMRYKIAHSLATEAPRNFKKKIELWKRCVRTVYPTIAPYQTIADEFTSRAKAISHARHHLIHGSWAMKKSEDGSFSVTNIKALRTVETWDSRPTTEESLRDMLAEISDLGDMIAGFIMSKMWHAHQGWLQVNREPSPEHPARPNPPTEPKR